MIQTFMITGTAITTQWMNENGGHDDVRTCCEAQISVQLLGFAE